VGLCKSLAAEYAPKYRVNCISPSLFKSKMSERLLKNDISKERIKNNNPLKKIGNTDDIASLLNFLLSDESQWITGQDISIDGGMSSLKL
ncbi:MAG: oxidoreductase, partial [Candidatus Marinimicrobia bacterium]|nr:oxidoreductase [Candidatus Neomarinimicrobiota bacterium]